MKKNLQLSSGGFPWVRAFITDEQLRWWKDNSRSRLEAPTGRSLSVVSGPEGSGLVWVRSDLGKYVPNIRLTRDEPPDVYDVRKAYDRAWVKKNPSISPHGAFLGLNSGDNFQLVQFLKTFGPLEWQGPETAQKVRAAGAAGVLLDIADFWRRQNKFRAVVALWDAFPDVERIAAALRVGFGYFARESYETLLMLEDARRTRAAGRPGHSRDADPPLIDQWLAQATDWDIRHLAVDVIKGELENVARGQARWLVKTRENDKPAFSLALNALSLWGAIWELFACDTYNGIIWRICPHCQKVFWPPRKDRFFCKPELQQRYSKRRWWNRKRGKNKEERTS